MKLIAIKTPNSSEDAAFLDQMYRLRSHVFADRLAWDVSRCELSGGCPFGADLGDWSYHTSVFQDHSE
ncbi:acyl-homoserine-lactone synthase (plasmid) [Rhizobium leguminosarum]